jgi:hypothetical protein|nr:MAG TPA: Major head protein [Caudoviricetes sp.]
MLKKKLFLPINLQLFAEPAEPAEPALPGADPEPTPAEPAEPTEPNNEPVDTDKIVEKLQKRLDSKTKSEKEAKSQLDKALERIAELENAGKKGVKELSEEEKAAKLQQEKDDEISRLKTQIKIAESTQQADDVLKEAGLVAGKEILTMIVSDDDQKTLENVKALIQYTNDQRNAWEVARNTGETPKKTPGNEEPDPFKAIAEKYN